MYITAALKGECGFKGCTFTHQENMVVDFIAERAVGLLYKFIKDPNIADAQVDYIEITLHLLILAIK